ncbi:ATP phosphoribosyltransferase (ATP-PRTase) (ATP-PRT) [Oleoguttula sp. CCFEE 5521]
MSSETTFPVLPRRFSRSLPTLTSTLASLNDRLLFAVPKKGRLHTQCLDLLSGSDIQFHRHNRLDIALVKNLPLALVFLPAADIPTFVGEGRVDLGITGRDTVAEHDAKTPGSETTGIEELLDLEFGKCDLQVQVPEKGEIQTPEQLVGRNIVTSFTALSEKYFRELEEGQDAKQGNESGETMRAAGLKAIATVVSSTAVLISSKHPSDPSLVRLIAARIRGVITAQKYVLCTYNVERLSLPKATTITPGRRAPTVTNLQDEQWVAVQAMVERKRIAQAMDQLSEMGATDIIVTKIENTRTV